MNLATEGKTIRSREDGLQEKIARFRKQEEEVRSLDLAFRDYVAALDTVSKAESRLMAAWAGNIQDTGDSPSYALTTLITKSHKQAKKYNFGQNQATISWQCHNIFSATFYPMQSMHRRQ